MAETRLQKSDRLRAAARAEAGAGHRDQAATHWRALLAVAPDDPEALNALGNWELAQGRPSQAAALLERAVAADPGQPALLFNLSAARRAAGDGAGALADLDRALAVDPYFVQAIFQKAVLLQELDQPRAAALIYQDFLDTAPPEIAESPRFAPLIARARDAVRLNNEALGALMAARVQAPSARTREAMASLLGEQRIHVAEPTFLTVPRLPAIPFFDRELTPWIADLEAAFEDILGEARAVIAGDAGLVPYVDNPPGVPANQWAGLDHSLKWGALFFWQHGARDETNCARCPRTAAALERMPLVSLEGRSPNAFFSVLAPRTRIPPHTGVTNARATVHLPLVVPPGCGFRVGPETREWVPGSAWVFDDTIEHEAWNESDLPRLILIFDVWNPLLAAEETAFVREMLAAHDAHYGRVGLSDTL
jgi:aspartyl/asparaginyl beta-hydroxylase (cupin superfamily)/Tfp pilus assembly protein PilF